MSNDSVDIVRTYPDASWGDDGPTCGVEAVVESGHVLAFPQLPFAFDAAEARFLDPRWADGKAKNVSVRWPSGELRGAAGEAADLAALKALIVRYAEQSEAFALRLFPHYRGHLRRGNTSFRPVDVAGRARSWRQDDTRLHIDAFPSNPMQGTRLLRVFCNVNPNGEPRRWRVGEAFEAHAVRYLGAIKRPAPGSAWLMHAAGITKRRRTEYDHLMLQLHDRAKADADFQARSPQARVDFAPGTTWVCYSDQVLHAAMGGQHMMEQTFYIDASHLAHPASAPLAMLERMTGRALLA
ncbi:MAG: Kdo hydroxylase family protein [Caldimonas sp.]